ncbi:MAG TPA: hydantoinase/oxoprolinase family protein [Candidatus Dormibacteraeota bacterium]|nr:hydantoinase/oxoprolinase family protein [Candidatus Dormibacteraeota bacterium]
MSRRFRLGVDVGGTFTDAVLISEETGEIHIAKVSTTPKDPSIGFLAAVTQILAKSGAQAPNVSYLVHGTTVATNALIEGKTPKTAFITTEGFRDLLEIGRQVRPSLYDIHFQKLRPLVPRDLCFEISERLDASGNVLRTLDEHRVVEIAKKFEQEDIRSVAICFLHSYLNPMHEERTEQLLRKHAPHTVPSVSSHICPEIREYFRASTTVVNACIKPVVANYLQGIESQLKRQGIKAELLTMQSNGGVLTFEQAAERPVFMIESGPAAGVIAANFIAGNLGFSDVVSFDMGGTTAKAGLILGGRPKVTKDYEVGAEARPGAGQSRGSGYPIRTPVIDLVEIGAGGGSIAWVDAGGVLRVGSQSAGADPGPICYRRGGTEPTITDANLALGRINPRYFLGGEMDLDLQGATEGIRKKCAIPLGLDTIAAANGIVEIANAAMVNALRLTTVRRGYDPRALVMVAFGGAGPLHANRLCAEMQIPRLIVPLSPGTASALGLLTTDVRHEFSRTRIMRADQADADAINRIFVAMQEEGSELLRREGIPVSRMSFLREIEMRYKGQSYELPVTCGTGPLSAEALAQVCSQFHGEYERAYGRGYPTEPVELVNYRVTAVGAIPHPPVRKISSRDCGVDQAQKGARQVFFSESGGFLSTGVYDRYKLGPGHHIVGPSVVEEMDSSTLIHPGFEANVDSFGNLLIGARAVST